jgi:hypothetical protein
MSGKLCPIGAKLGTDVLSLANRLLKNPITGIAVCCARAASGDDTAAPPSSAKRARWGVAGCSIAGSLMWSLRLCFSSHPKGNCPKRTTPLSEHLESILLAETLQNSFATVSTLKPTFKRFACVRLAACGIA